MKKLCVFFLSLFLLSGCGGDWDSACDEHDTLIYTIDGVEKVVDICIQREYPVAQNKEEEVN
jgi:uncharacterized protein YcfL